MSICWRFRNRSVTLLQLTGQMQKNYSRRSFYLTRIIKNGRRKREHTRRGKNLLTTFLLTLVDSDRAVRHPDTETEVWTEWHFRVNSGRPVTIHLISSEVFFIQPNIQKQVYDGYELYLPNLGRNRISDKR